MNSDQLSSIRKKILGELLKCSYCGLCEWVCPTLQANDNNREYGPRGRVNIIIFTLREGMWEASILDSIYSCLLCRACTTQCPAGIDIAENVRLFRYYVRERNISMKSGEKNASSS